MDPTDELRLRVMALEQEDKKRAELYPQFVQIISALGARMDAIQVNQARILEALRRVEEMLNLERELSPTIFPHSVS